MLLEKLHLHKYGGSQLLMAQDNVGAWHTLFYELELRPETVGAHRRAPYSMVKSIPLF
jgi:hypothetical protein